MYKFVVFVVPGTSLKIACVGRGARYLGCPLSRVVRITSHICTCLDYRVRAVVAERRRAVLDADTAVRRW